jgi:flagellar motor switch/type III secretory pathway protein FliN
MSELRIRSEAAAEAWPESWLPMPAGNAGRAADTGALVRAMADALSDLFERPVRALPASDEEAEALSEGGGDGARGEGTSRFERATRGGAKLAALLLSMRLGGGADKASLGGRVSGAVWARFRGEIERTARMAAPWPKDVAQLVLLVSVAGVEDLIEVTAPETRAEAAVARRDDASVTALSGVLSAVPMRLRVELAAELVSLSELLPLRVGQVLAIQPVAEMRLRMGDHAVGRVTLQAQADGRQAATLVAVDVDALDNLGERA